MADMTFHSSIALTGQSISGQDEVLSAPVLDLLAELHRRFNPRRLELMAARKTRQARLDAGGLPDFRSDTRSIRESDWRVAPIPAALQDRRVEITGPVDRKMIINALNSDAKVFMADFEDSTSPTWANLIEGQINLRDAVAGNIEFTADNGKHYALRADAGTVLMVRPRGWHLTEKHLCIEGERSSAGLFDLAVFAFHNAVALHTRQRGPYFYLPKLQSMEEAALWDEVMAFLEVRLGLPIGTMKVTVLIETLPAVFEMDEILHALRGRIVGLNCGRWDYIFSYIKTFRHHPDKVLPERGQVGMGVPFLSHYSQLLIKTCHRRGAFAMGGMAAQIPINHDPEANAKALDKVRTDKLREAKNGHDGTWVAHPALIPVAQAAFDEIMRGPNNLEVTREDVIANRDTLIAPSGGTITRAGFQANVDVCVRYLAAWLGGLGCVPIDHLMEDAATAEISRAQLWQWLHVGEQTFDDGAAIDLAWFDTVLARVPQRLPQSGLPGQDKIPEAMQMLAELTHAEDLAEFLTLPAYERL